jgi:exodeoxyribonuclease VII large subunit
MDDKLSLAELQLIIRDALYTSLPGMYWVSAEISEIKENYSGHCYLELIDKAAGEGNIKAKARAIIWANRYRMLKPFFENATGESMKEGMKVLMKVTLEYHEVYGLSLIVSDIDATYTVGEMVLRRLQIIRRLENEGVIEMNKEHPFPPVPRRIAIVSSKNAAGYTDFIRQLQGNINGYVFYTALFDSVMQGSETSKSLINALDRISENIELFDVIVVIRGGGSQTDLSWFDNYDIAFYMTQFPLPIITGIGHEKDMTVVDLVANISVKTPTAVADLLINKMVESESHIINLAIEIVWSSEDVIENFNNKIGTLCRDLTPAAKMIVSNIQEKLSKVKIGLISNGKDNIAKAIGYPLSQFSRLESVTNATLRKNESLLAESITNVTSLTQTMLKQKKDKIAEVSLILKIIDPSNVLKRGFTITLLRGKILKSSNQLTKDDLIDTQFSDGFVKSKVIKKKINKLI